MPFHVNIAGRGFSLRAATRFNLDEDELRSKFVEPWETGSEIVTGGKVFHPQESEIAILEGEMLTSEELQKITAWLVALDRSADVTDRFIVVAPGSRPSEAHDSTEFDARRVAVVHGRDSHAATALFDWLRAVGLRPLEWSQLVKATGSAAPSNRTVVEQLFSLAAVAVVLLTPDDEARLHPNLVATPDVRGEGAWACQPRPNVFLEAGMALAIHPNRTVFVEIGTLRLASNLHGINSVRLNGSAPPLHELVERLKAAGCEADTSGTDWLRADRFAGLDARTRLAITDQG